MADPRARAADLAQKLLRTASPTSGASENERQMAALHAAELFSQHDLTVVVPEPKPKRRRKPPPEPARARPYEPERQAYSVGDWREITIEVPSKCTQCGELLETGAPAWYDPIRNYTIHHDITCAESA